MDTCVDNTVGVDRWGDSERFGSSMSLLVIHGRKMVSNWGRFHAA